MLIRSRKALFVAKYVNLEEAAQVDGAKFEEFQVQYLNNTTRFGIDIKARQIAWSFTAALDAVADSMLNPGLPHLFVSVNRDEAKEKIRYTKAIIEAIREDIRPTMVRSSQTEVEIDNGSRFISHPCRPARGKAQARIYLDEMAHYPDGDDKAIYTAALPATTRGDGYIRIGSSPLGAKGLFWEIATQAMKEWPGFAGNRRFIPWWQVQSLCHDVKMAKQIAPEMLTQERVEAFGTQALLEIFENMFLEDFQQEYECAWIDEATAWITWETIKANQQKDLLWWHAKSVDEALRIIPQVQEAIKDKRVEPAFRAGIDVGRKKDLTEFMAVGIGTTKQVPLRISVSLDRVEFDDQEQCFIQLLERLPVTNTLVDQNGIGMQLAENLSNKTGKATGVDFTSATKEVWAVEARVQAQRKNTPLPMNRDIAYQIHSIKKTVTAAKHNKFDTARNERHHADKFWAWALAVYDDEGWFFA